MDFRDWVGDVLLTKVFPAIESAGRGVDRGVMATIEVVGLAERKAIEFAKEHPVVTVAASTLIVAGGAFVAAPVIAANIGAAGWLGVASTGTAIETLSGAALANASLAAIGGGSIAAGGSGIAGGTAVIAATGGLAGGAASAGLAKAVAA